MQCLRSILPEICKSLHSLVDSYKLWLLMHQIYASQAHHTSVSDIVTQTATVSSTWRCVCGTGDFQLQPAYQHHRVTVDVWRSMMEQQRQRVRDN